MAVADATTANTQFAPADQLAAQLIKIRVAKAYSPDGKVPTDVRTVALQTASKMLAVKQDPYVRAGVVNSAINIYIALDDWVRARDLLALEASTSNTPHYYIGDWPMPRSISATTSARSSCWPRRTRRRAARPRDSSGATSISMDCCGSRPTTPQPSRRWASR